MYVVVVVFVVIVVVVVASIFLGQTEAPLPWSHD
jgi:hypothetical protein